MMLSEVQGSVPTHAPYLLSQSEVHQPLEVTDQNEQSILLLYRTYANHIFVLAAGAFLIDKPVFCLKQTKTQNTRSMPLEMDDALNNDLKAKHLLNKNKKIT